MEKKIFSVFLIAMFLAMVGGVSAEELELVEELFVKATGQNCAEQDLPYICYKQYSSTALEEGTSYLIEVSGNYSYHSLGICDASYCKHKNWGDFWFRYIDVEPYGGILQLWVDDELPEWGAFNPEHIYSTEYTGKGTIVSFSIADGWKRDNSGGLTVKIYKITAGDKNRGHGNDPDGVDEDNPGKGCEKKNANGNQKRC